MQTDNAQKESPGLTGDNPARSSAKLIAPHEFIADGACDADDNDLNFPTGRRRREDLHFANGSGRSRQPDPSRYFEEEGLILTGHGEWRSTECRFHGGSDSMRVSLVTGAWCCMDCGAKGADLLAYHWQLHGLKLPMAARQLEAGPYDSGDVPLDPAQLSPLDALQVIAFEANLVAVEGARQAHGGVPPSERDLSRVLIASRRISQLAEAFS